MAISPIIDHAAQSLHRPYLYTVARCSYGLGAERPQPMRRHRTLKAACRTLASVCSGKRRRPGDFAAFVIFPNGEPFSLNEARKVKA